MLPLDGCRLEDSKNPTLFLMMCGPTKSDASGGGVFRNSRGAAEGALIRAAASTQSFDSSLLLPCEL